MSNQPAKAPISRKKKLVFELKSLASQVANAHPYLLLSKLCSILSRFDLGEEVDDLVTQFLAEFEAKFNSLTPQQAQKELTSILCRVYEIADTFRDFSE